MPTINRLIADKAALDRAALVVAAWARCICGASMKTASGTASPIRARISPVARRGGRRSHRTPAGARILGTQIPRSLAFRDAFERNLLRLRTLG